MALYSSLDGMIDNIVEVVRKMFFYYVYDKDTIDDFAGRLGEAVKPLTEIVIKIGDTAWNIFVGTLGIINDLVMSIADALINMDVD